MSPGGGVDSGGSECRTEFPGVGDMAKVPPMAISHSAVVPIIVILHNQSARRKRDVVVMTEVLR